MFTPFSDASPLQSYALIFRTGDWNGERLIEHGGKRVPHALTLRAAMLTALLGEYRQPQVVDRGATAPLSDYVGDVCFPARRD